MGVYANYVAVPPEEIARAQEDEELWGRLSFVPPEHYPQCDLQRTWGTLGYLLDPDAQAIENLKRASNILGKAVMGAHVFGFHFCVKDKYRQEVDNAYNHPRYLTAEEVQEAAVALADVTREELCKPYDFEQVVWYTLKDEDIAWMYFQKLRAFYIAAAARGDKVVLHIW